MQILQFSLISNSIQILFLLKNSLFCFLIPFLKFSDPENSQIIQMKQLFYEKGQKIQISPQNQYLVQTSNNLDSKKYVLQRIPLKQFLKYENYIEKHYYFSRQDNLISYFNCWKQSQNVPSETKSIQNKQKQTSKKPKRGMLDIMKRKSKIIQPQQLSAPSKKKIVQDSGGLLQNNTILQQFVYIQMQYFSEIQIPNDFVNLRDLFIIIYLVGLRMASKTQFIPCLLPVKNQQNDRIKFYKKSISQSWQIQLYRLMMYLFKDKQQAYLKQWSETLYKSIFIAQINSDENLCGALLKKAIQDYLQTTDLNIKLINEEERISSEQKVKIILPSTLKLQPSQIQFPLEQYKIQYLLKSQTDRQINLTHQLFEEYTLSGKKNNLIVKLLYHMAT